jgi:iron complex outermembrane receptor protein
LQLLAGFRYDNATSHFKATERLPTSSPYYYGDYKMQSDDDKTTPRVGLLWHPIPEFSLYGNYVENFGAPNMTTVSSVGGATPLGPQTAQQWEVGMKGELFNGRLTGSLAWFNLTKQNIPAADPNNPLKTVLMGEARNQGLEIDLAGEVLPGWRIIAAGAYIDSVITKDSQPEYAANGALIGTNNGNMGKHLYNVPKFSGSVWNTYEWQDGPWRGLKIGGGIVGRSQAEGDSANTFQLPSYVLTNLMLAYPIQYGRSKVHLQLNVDNLLDKSYFYSSTGTAWNGAHYGAPRTILGSIRLEF